MNTSQQLTTLRSHPDETLCHEARIAGKRLRYLLEPLCHSKPLKRRIIAPLTTIQVLLAERRQSAWQNLRINLNGDDNLFETLLVELESPESVGIYVAT